MASLLGLPNELLVEIIVMAAFYLEDPFVFWYDIEMEGDTAVYQGTFRSLLHTSKRLRAATFDQILTRARFHASNPVEMDYIRSHLNDCGVRPQIRNLCLDFDYGDYRCRDEDTDASLMQMAATDIGLLLAELPTTLRYLSIEIYPRNIFGESNTFFVEGLRRFQNLEQLHWRNDLSWVHFERHFANPSSDPGYFVSGCRDLESYDLNVKQLPLHEFTMDPDELGINEWPLSPAGFARMHPLSTLHWEVIEGDMYDKVNKGSCKYHIAPNAELLETIKKVHGETLKELSICYRGYPFLGEESKGSRYVDLRKIDWDEFRRHFVSLKVFDVQMPINMAPERGSVKSLKTHYDGHLAILFWEHGMIVPDEKA
ncbi:hypothetical protein NLG97_g6294 [Lecanicillium saksenae]|uniref:Uncharacterized protein n=1 Tax=Lecanicillium saksenae TaxID=468837 RepID=A0ACC1QRP1_9HYPO|nr:hypothetical protein NLG97_g6294 [Lecanicillium saksenae]